MDSNFDTYENWNESDDSPQDYGDACFIYEGTIYTVINASEESILHGLNMIYTQNNDPSMKLQALKSMSSHMAESITYKYCQ